MKRITLLALVGLVLFSLSCSWFDWHNDIQYPAAFYMSEEVPGDPIRLRLFLTFKDQTPDSSGVIFDWGQRGDTFWFLLKGTDCDIGSDSLYENWKSLYVSDLDTGTYTLLFEGEDGVTDTFLFEVEDSVYRMVGDSGKVAHLADWTMIGKELRRIFPDMLLVETGYYWSQPYEEDLDSLDQELLNSGAKECPLNTGAYLLQFWGWDQAFIDGWLESSTTQAYTYDGDTAEISAIFDKYKQRFQALGIGMGNGFRRLYEAWDNY